MRFLDGVKFSLEDLRYEYPDETVTGYPDPQKRARSVDLARRGEARFPMAFRRRCSETLKRELRIVGELKYAPYFLTVRTSCAGAREGG